MDTTFENMLPRVYGYALSICGDPERAEELTQEVMLRAWKARKTLRRQVAAHVWFFKITANVWKDHCRRARHPVARAETMRDEPSCAGDPAELLQRQDEATSIRREMERLPARQRQVLYLFTWQQLSIAQIADVLQIEPGAVKSSLYEARRQLRRRVSHLLVDQPDH